MACNAPSRECLEWHVRPKLDGATTVQRDSEGFYYFTVRCPAHDDGKPSLKISQGKQRRLVWFCHAGCADGKVRHALIGCHIDAACLPRSTAEMRDFEESLRTLLTSDLGHADVRLRALAMLDSPGGELPRGRALVELAGRVGVSRTEAFRARAVPLPRTTR